MDWALIRLDGPDSASFLQGQLTCDVTKIPENCARLCAHCNAKGRIVFSAWIFGSHEFFTLLLPREMADMAQNSLRRFAVFSKVNLSLDLEPQLVWQTVAKPSLDCKQLEHTDLFFTQSLKQNAGISGEQITHHLIQAGIAMILPITSEKFTPHDLNYPRLNGVQFDKGCYIGQEIVARMEHLGKPKRHLYRHKLSISKHNQIGTEIMLGDQSAGLIVSLATKPNSDKTIDCLTVLADKYAKDIAYTTLV